MGMPGGYGSYGSSPAGYNPSSAAAAGNSTANEEIAASQFKENSVYITGQQVRFCSLLYLSTKINLILFWYLNLILFGLLN